MHKDPIKVLVIEDNPADARLLQALLEEVPKTLFDLEFADLFSTGRERLAAGGISVVLLDLQLPDARGVETVAELHRLAPQVPIVVLTGLEDETLAIKAVQMGGQDYLIKGQVTGTLLNRAIGYAIERKRAEEVLREERAFAEDLFDMAQAIVLVLDEEGRIVRFNPSMTEASGYLLAEVQGRDAFTTFFDEPHHASLRGIFRRALDGCQVAGVRTRMRTKSGGEREMDWRVRTLKNTRSVVTGVLFLGHDVTKWKEAEAGALQSERLAAVGQMVAGLAHESRNALQRGQSGLERLAIRLQTQPEALVLVANIQRALDDLGHLYRELREYAAPINLHRQVCNLRIVLHQVWSHLRPLRDGRQIQLREDSSGLDRFCEVDPFSVEQVFRNILENSFSACSDPVDIQVAWTAVELDGRPAIRVALRDNGPGLTLEQRQKIFEPFYTTKVRGTGLGMSIAKRIVEAHHGQIAVGSDSSPGTEILVTLPRGKL